MVSQEDLDAFLARIRRHGGRVSQLGTGPSFDAREALLAALTELEMMYEDLLVADEELRVQSEELRASHYTLAATRSRYAELFAAAPVGYVVTTGDGIILETNRLAAELFGNPARGGLGKPLQVYVDMVGRPRLRQLMLSVLRNGGLGSLDVTIVPRTGRRLDVTLTVARAVDPHGGMNTLRWGLTPPGSGLSEAAAGLLPAPDGRAAAGSAGPGAAARLDRLLLDALFEDGSVGLLLVGADLRVRRASPALTGGGPVAGATLNAVLADGAAPVGRLVQACLASGRPTRVDVDGRTRADPDRPRRWRVSAFPLTVPDDGTAAVGCLLVDVPVDGHGGTGMQGAPPG